jgi:predicted transcriptional regulator
MGMSKTALHHHLKILRETGMVEVSREEEARGSINKKYFRRTQGPKRFHVDDLNHIEDPKQRLTLMKIMLKTLRTVYTGINYRMNLMIEFTQQLEQELDTQDEIDAEKLNQYQDLLQQNNTHLRNIPLGQEQYPSYKELEREFFEKVEALQQDHPVDEFPSLVTLLDMPIQHLLEFHLTR